MWRVLVVDDEKLVRRGILSTFPWKQHGFVVAGEAASAEHALELIRQDPPDLVFTDLTMPGLSGFDLIRAVQSDFPAVATVVLTCHDSFQFVQEAMRMGVLDYIVKTELEDEAIEQSLSRIASKLGHARSGGAVLTAGFDRGVLVCGKALECDRSQVMPLFGDARALVEIDNKTWFLPLAPGEEGTWESLIVASHHTPQAFEAWVFVLVTGVPGSLDAATADRLRRYRWSELFYGWTDRQDFLRWAVGEAGSERGQNGAVAGWLSPGWVFDDDIFQSLLAATRDASWEPSHLWSHFDSVALEWDRLAGLTLVKELKDRSPQLLFWAQWAQWLGGVRRDLASALERRAPPAAAQSILKATEYLRQQQRLDVGADEVAWQVGMSRSYFCQCFQKVTGRSFGGYLKELRLERAKALLLAGSIPIGRIAEECGFQDHRYFSRVFRSATGLLPNEFRGAARAKV